LSNKSQETGVYKSTGESVTAMINSIRQTVH